MRRKCAFCDCVKKVRIQSFAVDGKAFCSAECAWNYHTLKRLAEFVCVRCGAPIRMNAIVKGSWNSHTPDEFYCCERCAMDDLGLIELEDDRQGVKK
jgi:hypothetical protein